MINFNGNLYDEGDDFLDQDNRAFRYGDALFETIKVVNGEIFFWEEHYLRLMSSMRILRMEIPMNFTMEYLSEQINAVINANALDKAPARIRLTVFRNNGGFYLPSTNDVSFVIESSTLNTPFFTIGEEVYTIELFKDFYVNPDMLSTLKTNNRIINVVGSIYAKENGYDNCILLNRDKKVVEVLNGNIFLVKGTKISTPPLKDGCINGIIRKKIIDIVNSIDGLTLHEESISPFDLLKADELFITNAIKGIQPITKYRKKEFGTKIAKDLLGKLNVLVRLK